MRKERTYTANEVAEMAGKSASAVRRVAAQMFGPHTGSGPRLFGREDVAALKKHFAENGKKGAGGKGKARPAPSAGRVLYHLSKAAEELNAALSLLGAEG